MRSVLRAFWLEWIGDGIFLGRGNWSEVVWSAITLTTGLYIWSVPSSMFDSHAWDAFVWRYPLWLLVLPCIASGVLSFVGISLYFVRGRCLLSRWTRAIGGLLGLFIWSTLAANLARTTGGNLVSIIMYVGGALTYLRTTQLAYRRR